jgi:hypothetical protein
LRLPSLGSLDRSSQEHPNFDPATFDRSHLAFPGVFDRGAATRAALKAGLLGILVAMLPLIGCVATGWLAVYFYRRERGITPPTAIGARLGGAAGVVVSAINALFTILVIIFHAQQRVVDQLVEFAQKFGIDTSTQQFRSAASEIFTPSGVLSSFIVTVLFAAIGGALAVVALRRPPRP